MRLLINASTLSGTGVTQVAVSFISECKAFVENEYHVFMSLAVSRNIETTDFADNFHFYVFDSHPFYGISGYKIRKKLAALERLIKPDLTFSIFGPSYWTPLSPHLMGFAYPHYVYLESPIFGLLDMRRRIMVAIYKYMHKFFLKRNGSFYVCETEDVKQRLVRFLKISASQIFTVGNTCNHYFLNFKNRTDQLLPARSTSEFRFLSLCSPYIHKNLTILNKVIPILKSKYAYLNIKFVITIDDMSFETLFADDVKDYILNVGSVKISDCPQLYSECDALFLPTLLECFSANYPEAMYMQKPILTSNMSFATTVCGNAALYFNPLDERQITEKIFQIVTNVELRQMLIKSGIERFNTFPSSTERAIQYLNICSKLLNNKLKDNA